jgi:hypothetical protein
MNQGFRCSRTKLMVEDGMSFRNFGRCGTRVQGGNTRNRRASVSAWAKYAFAFDDQGRSIAIWLRNQARAMGEVSEFNKNSYSMHGVAHVQGSASREPLSSGTQTSDAETNTR